MNKNHLSNLIIALFFTCCIFSCYQTFSNKPPDSTDPNVLAIYCRVEAKGLADKGKYDEALSNYKTALGYYRSVNGKSGEDGQATCYTDMGICYHKMGQDWQAVDALLKALSIYKSIGENTSSETSYAWLALWKLKNFEEERPLIVTLQKHLDRYMENNDKLSNDEVLAKYREALKISELTEFPMYITEYNLWIGLKLYSMDQKQEALDHYFKATKYYRQNRNTAEATSGRMAQIRIYTYRECGRLLMEFGRDKEALEYLEKAVSEYKDIREKHPLEGFMSEITPLIEEARARNHK